MLQPSWIPRCDSQSSSELRWARAAPRVAECSWPAGVWSAPFGNVQRCAQSLQFETVFESLECDEIRPFVELEREG